MSSSNEKANAIDIPPHAQLDPKAAEIMRAWIASGGLQVSFRLIWPKPDNFGILLMDIARHAARAYENEGQVSYNEALRSILQMFDAERENCTDPGSTVPLKNQVS